MIREIMALADAMGVPFEKDYVKVNLEILSHLSSGVHDFHAEGCHGRKQSEIDGLVYEVVRMGEEYHVPTPEYKKIAEKLKLQYKKSGRNIYGKIQTEGNLLAAILCKLEKCS